MDKDKADCHYEQGVLTITFPKVEAKKAKQLKVSVGGQPKAIETRGKAA